MCRNNCVGVEKWQEMNQRRLGVVNSKKFCCWKRFSTDFGPKVTDLPSIFHLTSIWSSTAASKSEAPKSTLLYKSCSNKKNLLLLYNKIDFGASDFEVAVHLQTEAKWKMLGRSVTFGPKSVEKHFQRGTLKNLTTPIRDKCPMISLLRYF